MTKPGWYWEVQDYGPVRLVRVRWWHFGAIIAVLGCWVILMAMALGVRS